MTRLGRGLLLQDADGKLWTVPVLFGTSKAGDKPALELMKGKTLTIKVRPHTPVPTDKWGSEPIDVLCSLSGGCECVAYVRVCGCVGAAVVAVGLGQAQPRPARPTASQLPACPPQPPCRGDQGQDAASH